MINLSQKNVVKIAKETNFIKDNVEKVMRLADILEFVFTSKWKDKLALKGGTRDGRILFAENYGLKAFRI